MGADLMRRSVTIAGALLLLAWIVPLTLPGAGVEARGAPEEARGERRAGPVVELGGDRERDFRSAPVYRRFGQLTVYVRGLDAAARGQGERLVVTKQPAWVEDADARRVVVDRSLDELPTTPDRRAARAHVQLGEPGRSLAIGRYRLKVWLDDGQTRRAIAQRMLIIIFNAHHPADHGVYQEDAARWLDGELEMVRLHQGEPGITRYELDRDDRAVLALALTHLEGAQTAADAARRAAAAAVEHVDGYWPGLTDEHGELPSQSPSGDPQWSDREEYRSAAERLRAQDQRGQCFDYTMLYVAVLRSVGVPSRAASVIDPGPIPHPYDADHRVAWMYHVWPEVFVAGDWHAADVTYKDEDLADDEDLVRKAGLQSRHGRWFAPMLEDGTEILTARDGKMHEITEEYQSRRRR